MADPKKVIMCIRIWGYGLLLLIFRVPGYAQPGSIEGTDIEIESMLIDASKEKLLGNQDKAIALYQDILKKSEGNPTANYELARLFAAKASFEDALEYSREAVEADPVNVWYRLLLADLYRETGQFKAGADVYSELRATDPNNQDYYYKEAFFLVKANQLKEAQKVYSALEDRIGINEELIQRRHTLYLGMGDLKKAAQELEKLIDAFPDNTDYLHHLAEFHQKTGSYKDAQKVYERILALSPDDAKAQLALAGGNIERSNDVTYLNQMRPVFEDPGTQIDLKIGRLMPIVEKVSQSGDRNLADAALRLTAILEEVHPGQAKAFAASGDLLFLSQRPGQAATKYTRALKLDDTNFLLWENLFAALKNSGNYQWLFDWSEEAMFVFPNQALVYYMNGYALMAQAQYQDALGVLNEALLMSGENKLLQQTIISAIGMIYEQLGDEAEANDAFQKAIEINPTYPLPKARYAEALAQRGDESAIKIAEESLKGNGHEAEVMYRSGLAYFYADQNKEALKWLELAVKAVGETHPNYLEHFGDALYQNGNEDRALEYWNKALEGGRDSELLRKKIADKKLYK